jgi:hypothetical protein
MRKLIACCSLLLLCSVACASHHRMVEPEPVDDFDQQQWANTSPYGDGAQSSTGYYGVGSSGTEATPTHTAANPQPRSSAREPASPKSGRARVEP